VLTVRVLDPEAPTVVFGRLKDDIGGHVTFSFVFFLFLCSFLCSTAHARRQHEQLIKANKNLNTVVNVCLFDWLVCRCFLV